MWTRKVLWIFLMIAACLMYLFENGQASFFLCSCIIIIPMVSIGHAWLASRKISYEIAASNSIDKGESIEGHIIFHNKGLLTTNNLNWKLTFHNIRTEEKQTEQHTCTLPPKDDNVQKFTSTPAHCGVIKITVTDACVEDVFGIARFGIKQTYSTECVLWPKRYEIKVRMRDTGLNDMDSQEYSEQCPGNDPSETFAIREYMPGDSIKHIHWKLSEKTNQIMVRELGQSIVKRVLLLWETNMEREGDLDVQDVAFDALTSLGYALLRECPSFDIGFCDNENGGYKEWTIQNESDMTHVCENLLRIPVSAQSGTATEHYVQRHPHCNYAHVVVVSGISQRGMKDLYSNNCVLCLCPSEKSLKRHLQSDGTEYIAFDYRRVADEIKNLEI